MTYKTIVAIIQSRRGHRARARMRRAARRAPRQPSHRHPRRSRCRSPMTSAWASPTPNSCITTGEINRKRAAELEARSRQRLGEAGLPFEWRASKASPATARSRRAPARARPTWSSPPKRDPDESRAERRSRRPALRDRPAGAAGAACRACSEGPFRKVLVAWNGSREAARAAFDALPFIMEADETEHRHHRSPATTRRSRARRLAAALARHGAHVSVNELSSAGRPIADVIADHVDASGADLLVHGRLRPFVAARIPVRRRHPLGAARRCRSPPSCRASCGQRSPVKLCGLAQRLRVSG